MSLWPVSTAGQADEFRKKVDKERFLSLSGQKWAAEPNLNFSFVRKKLVWAKTAWGTRKYFEYFFEPDTRRYGGKQFEEELSPAVVEEWERQGLIDPETGKEIERQRQTNRNYLNVNPEFLVYRDWDLDEVIELEEQGKLEEVIIRALGTPLATWGEALQTP